MKNLIADTNGTIIAKKCDVTDESEVLSVFEWIKLKYGHLDVFVNNAGVMKPDFLLGKTSIQTIVNGVLELDDGLSWFGRFWSTAHQFNLCIYCRWKYGRVSECIRC